MAFDVTTYTSEEALAEAIQATVSTHSGEEALEEALEAATKVHTVVAKGGYFTLIDEPLVIFLTLRVLAKGGYFTVILET